MNEASDKKEEPDALEAATAWWVRRDAGPLTREEDRAFAAWLAADAANAAAYDEIAALCGEVRALRPRMAQAPRRRRRIVAMTALAASLAGVAAFDQLALVWRADARTGVGETRVVRLEDGSRVTLAGRSAIAIHYGERRRGISLLEGEAFFEAAPDAARPFVVAAAGASVTALGTAFDMSLDSAGARVTVAEHAVTVESGGRATRVDEGRQSAFVEGGPASAPSPVAVDDLTAWRRGRLIFVDRPLGEVVDILARYHRGYIVVASEALRRLRVTGVFDAGDPIGALRAVEASLELDAIHLTDYLVLLRR
ncbi:FecR family protein [Methylosinus sp. Sm6]|uniref:FecR family protein n=1 Tax=Methylosinus sp. Sm6 TaxID=2866948 RepID=UPI001C991B67|nr:FecR domain-containing protein [Methylosinus sp. Sm6]MBY6241999.1 FecR domain-containing protein [Methylosinus sp. Sm6]